ncbi:hypothetical protein CKA32_002409 [Geitlerinema sp. FC II]|nr:hypothetical protein CKA32_002409 [Geitlerinema sp. FC II]
MFWLDCSDVGSVETCDARLLQQKIIFFFEYHTLFDLSIKLI